MDFDAALAYLADDCEYTNIPMSTVRGHIGVREVLTPFFGPIHENEFIIVRKAAAGIACFEIASFRVCDDKNHDDPFVTG